MYDYIVHFLVCHTRRGGELNIVFSIRDSHRRAMPADYSLRFNKLFNVRFNERELRHAFLTTDCPALIIRWSLISDL